MAADPQFNINSPSFLLGTFFYMICGYVWICGFVDVDVDMWMWICGCGYVDMWICRYVDMWICGFVDM